MYGLIHRLITKWPFKPRERHTIKTIALLCSLCLWLPLANAQLSPSTNQAITAQPPKTMQTRGQTALVQEIVMGPQAYELWQKIQQLIENPDLKDFSRLVQIFDLQIKEPMDVVNWQTMRTGRREDIRGKQRTPMIKSGRYGVGISYPGPERRFINFEIEFDVNEFCLSKQEIQRLYQTTLEGTPTHSLNWGSQDNIGFWHNFGLKDRAGGFAISASGCALKFSASQNLEALNQEQTK